MRCPIAALLPRPDQRKPFSTLQGPWHGTAGRAVHLMIGSSIRVVNGHDPVPNMPDKALCVFLQRHLLDFLEDLAAQACSNACF